MSYYHSKIINDTFKNTVEKVIASMSKEGFGVLTDIDVRATLQKKLGVDFRQYRILGMCNPPFALQALQAERMIGSMLPCNVIVQETEEGKTEIAAVDPAASMQAVQNDQLLPVAQEVRRRLFIAIDQVE